MSETPLVAPAATAAKSRNDRSLGIAGATLAVTAWGTSGIIVRFIDMGAFALIAYRFLLYAIVVTVVLAVRRTPVTRAGMRHSLWGGLSMGATVGLFITAVKYTTIANVTIMNALHVVVVSTHEYTACVAIYVGVISLPLAALFGQDLSWPRGEDWMWLVVLAFGLGILGHNAMNWSLQHVPLWLASTLSLFTPVVASALAWLVLDEALSTRQMLAMALVVAALAMIVRNQSRPRSGGARSAGDDQPRPGSRGSAGDPVRAIS